MTNDESEPHQRLTSSFWPAFWLGAVLLATKILYLSQRAPHPPEDALAFIASLAAISHRDLLFALGVGFLHRAVTLGLRPAPARTLHRLVCALAAFGAAYAVANLEVFAYFSTPLTYPLLKLSGGFRAFQTSVAASLSTPVVLGMVGVSLGFSWICSGSQRLAELSPRRALRVAQTLLVAFVVGWAVWGEHVLAASWHERIDWRIAESAHYRFLASMLTAAGADGAGMLPDTLNPADLADFRTVAEGQPASRAVSLRESAVPRARIRNVILLVLESVSARSLELYGSPYPATPNLTSEASHALVFDNIYSHAGRSSDTLAALLLSLHPPVGSRDVTTLEPRLEGPSLPELLAERGERTRFVTSSDLGWANWRGFLEGRGFESVRDFHDLGCGEPLSSWGAADGCAVDGVLDFIAEDPSRPFFAMAWTVQTHHPYEPSPEAPFIDFFGAEKPNDDYDFGRYLNVLHETDRHLGRLFAELRARELDRDTLVVVVGDHGEAFGQPHRFYGHGTTLYEEGVRVPLVLWSPRLFPRGGRAAVIGSHVDLAQTIAELAGVPPAPVWQGRSLLDPAHPPRAYFFMARDDLSLGVREQQWKYILDVTQGREELYDLRADPDERVNLAEIHPDKCRRLRQRLRARLEADRRPRTEEVAAGM